MFCPGGLSCNCVDVNLCDLLSEEALFNEHPVRDDRDTFCPVPGLHMDAMMPVLTDAEVAEDWEWTLLQSMSCLSRLSSQVHRWHLGVGHTSLR